MSLELKKSERFKIDKTSDLLRLDNNKKVKNDFQTKSNQELKPNYQHKIMKNSKYFV